MVDSESRERGGFAPSVLILVGAGVSDVIELVDPLWIIFLLWNLHLRIGHRCPFLSLPLSNDDLV